MKGRVKSQVAAALEPLLTATSRGPRFGCVVQSVTASPRLYLRGAWTNLGRHAVPCQEPPGFRPERASACSIDSGGCWLALQVVSTCYYHLSCARRGVIAPRRVKSDGRPQVNSAERRITFHSRPPARRSNTNSSHSSTARDRGAVQIWRSKERH